jgi:hypothetical protein
MARRTAKFVSVIFAGLLGSAAVSAVSSGTVRAADDCLSGPQDHTPAGGHWYYRIEHATKRHCWYLRNERENLSQAATPDSSPPADPEAPKAETVVLPSIANAHAELPTPAAVAPSARNDVPVAAKPADTAPPENNGTTNPGNAESQRSIFASRWPDQSEALASTSSAPQQTQPAMLTEQQAQPAIVTEQFATADSSSSQPPTSSVPMLLCAIMAALVLAAITASIVKFGRARRHAAPAPGARRDAIWASVDSDRGRRPDFTQSVDKADDRDARIASFFAHIATRGRSPGPATSPAAAATPARRSSGRYGVRA